MRPRIGITSAPTVHDQKRIERLNRSYVDAIAGAGGLPVILPTLPAGDAAEILAGVHGLVLTGGGDVAPWRYGQKPAPEVYDIDTARDDWEAALIEAAGHEVPILGVCRGAQLLNVVAGGTLIQHLETDVNHRQREHQEEVVHPVEVAAGSRLAEILESRRIGVNSVHHQAIDRVGSGLRAVAWAPDGTIEAVEGSEGAPFVAVQWHPEALTHLAPHARLFVWLTRAAARRHPGLVRPEGFTPPDGSTAGLGHVVDEVA
ncbi:MAG TPA: gamma-glutamyl-gamma-aminobutyrate hydrolase family protein [Acidimicrobiales bacterium]|jgi:putative glutamine amidotransferase|nr:gamma-glutamyl-gamma-aminobutyrate hydrolase family protein [Acidimicrobiales bacterium]